MIREGDPGEEGLQVVTAQDAFAADERCKFAQYRLVFGQEPRDDAHLLPMQDINDSISLFGPHRFDGVSRVGEVSLVIIKGEIIADGCQE